MLLRIFITLLVFLSVPGINAQNPIVQTYFTADPAPMVYNDTVYVYTTHDEDETVDNFFTMYNWRAYSSVDMVNWTDHGVVASLKDFAWSDKTNGAWAPQAIERNGQFYLYCPIHGDGVAVLVADSPTGPFRDPLGKRLIDDTADIWHDIDPTVFVDDDGQAYLFWGNPSIYYVKLNEDMISYDRSIGQKGIFALDMTHEAFGSQEGRDGTIRSNYTEGPWVYKRKDLYYLVYAAAGIPEYIAYSTAPAIEGPWTYRGYIMERAPHLAFTNHPGIIDYKGNAYFFYHTHALSGGEGFKRSVSLEQFEYNADGTIPMLLPTKEGVKESVAALNPYKRVEAETIAWSEGLKTKSDNEVGIYVTHIQNGDYLKVRSVDFGQGAKRFSASVASASKGGSIEIRLGGVDGTLLGVCEVENTGGWPNWKTRSAKIKKTKGVHDVYLVFKGSEDQLFNFDWWEFSGAQSFLFQNPDLSSEERAKDLISRLTVEEKAALLCDQSEAIPRLGIDRFNWWSEALHGYANNDDVTVFPQNIGMAASFNDELLFRIFDATSDEARALYHESQRRGEENRRFLSLSVWTPNVNIFRDPRWGRGQETYGEDPYLMQRMGVQVVKGLQGPEDAKYRKLLACAKHYAVHSGPEWSRHELNLNNVSPREFYETYMPAFKSLVQEADVRQVMCAYQRLDDEPCCSNTRLLQRILREEWGYEYLVVADCGAITDFHTTHNISSTPLHAAATGLLAGTDLECIWDNYHYKMLPEALEKDLIKEEDIDRSLLRVLIGRFDLGEMDDEAIVPWAQIPLSIVNNEEHRQLAYQMAQESMTLLYNKDKILPLNKSSVKKIAVIGPNADDEEMLWGNYNGTPVRTITILDGIESKISSDKIFYDKAVDLIDDKVTISYFSKGSVDGKKGFKATYWNHPDFEGEPVAVQQLTNAVKQTAAGQHEFAPGVRLEDFSAKYETEFTAEVTEELVFKGGVTGFFEFKVNGEVLETYTNWRTLPTRIPFTVEAGKSYQIEIRYAQRENWQANVELDFGREENVDYATLIKRLEGIETVVFVGGLSGHLEGEEMPVSFPGFKGGDRTNIDLPSVQVAYLKALKDAGKKVVFVNCSGSAIGFGPVMDYTDAILQAWYGGESGGQAVADVLFGDYNPSGKLPVTFYANSDKLGDIEDYSMKGKTYRYTTEHLFPFGFGLSYTDFEVGKAQLSQTTKKVDEAINISIPVRNTGQRDGVELVQVYVRKVGDTDGPLKTLRGFQKVEVAAGMTVQASIDLSPSAFEFYDWDQRKMTIVPGEYEVFYGNSSDEKDLKSLAVKIQ